MALTQGDARGARGWMRVRNAPLAVAIAVLLVPFAVLLVRVFTAHYTSTSDLAIMELRVRSVGGAHTPLVGAYSRYPWYHPGPLLYYVLAVPYRALGSSSAALLAGGTLLSLGASAACLALCWRRGRVAGLALGGLVLLVLLRALGGGFLLFPWNPYAVVLPMLALALLVWCIACGDHWLLSVAVAMASFAIQSHVGTAVVATALVACGTIAFATDAGRGRAKKPLRTVLVATVVGLVLWLPPLVDQFRPDGGNLTELWRFWTGSHEAPLGWAGGARIVFSQFQIQVPWMTGHEHAPLLAGVDPGWSVPWVLFLTLAAGVFSWRRRDRVSFALVAVALVFAAAAWVSVSRIVDLPYSYVMRWSWLVGALAWLAIGWTALRAVTDGRVPVPKRTWRLVGVVTAGAAATLAFASTVSAVNADFPDARLEAALQHLAPSVIEAARASDQPVVVDPAADGTAPGLAAGLMLRLDRAGVDARLPYGLEPLAGREAVLPRREARSRLVVATYDTVQEYERDSRYARLASFDALSPEERAFKARVDAQLESVRVAARTPTERLFAVGHWTDTHPETWSRYLALAAADLRAAVFIDAPDQAKAGSEGP